MPNGSFQLPILPRFGDPTTQLQDFATRDYVDNAILAAATASGYALRGSANTFTAANTFSANGALSAPAVSFTGTPITGGTAATTTPLFKIGSGANGNYSVNGTYLDINAESGFSGSGQLLTARVNGGSALFILTAGGGVTIAGSSFAGSSGQIGWTSRGIFTSPATGQIQLGAADAAAPVAQTLSAQSVVAGTTDTAGAAFTIKGSAGTGAGAGGVINFSIAPAGGAGSVQNTFVTPWRISATGHLIAPTDNTYDIGASSATRPRLIYTSAGAVLNNISVGSGASSALIRLTASSDGVFKISNDALTDFNRIQLGGTTSSFPSLKRSTTILQARLADDSAYSPIEASTVRVATAYTVATLPAAGTAGRIAYVTDGLAPTYLAAVVGGGAVVTPVFDNGTTWVCH